MKKSLFAIAAVTAFAGAAQAQSSVTVYGILDVGYIGASNRLSTNQITNNGGNSKGTYNSLGASAETSSRLGFRGTEDLGGGVSAFFTAEFQLYPTDQNLSGNGSTTAASNAVAGLVNRQSFVGLSKKGLGQFAVGTQYTPVFNASSATDPGQHNNIVGNVIYSSASGGGAVAEFDNDGNVNTSFTNRTTNTLTAKSANFAGFTVGGMYTLNNKTTTQTAVSTGGEKNADGWGLSVDYTWKKLYAVAAYQALNAVTTGQAGSSFTPWSAAQGSGATTSPATAASLAANVKDNQYLIGTTYDFGILKAYAQYVNRKASSNTDSSYYTSRTAQQIGVRGFITKTVEGWASAGNGRYAIAGQSAPSANFNGWQLGSNYYLSKRTNLYAIYGQTVFSQATSGSVYGNAAASNYALGVRHTF